MIWHASFRTVVIAGIAMALVAPLVSCGGDDSGDKVGAQLQEYKIIPDTGDMKTGKIKFETENVGGSTHEFVVVRADTPESLPTKPDGSVDEAKIPASDKVGEIEDVAPKQKKTATFDLAPGKYVFFCNIVDKGTPPISHFQKGMSAEFTVSN